MVKKVVVKKEVKKDSIKKNFSFGLVSYVLGIIAIVEAFISPFAGIIFGIIGLNFSSREKSPLAQKAKKLNTISIIIGVIVLVAILIFSAMIQQI